MKKLLNRRIAIVAVAVIATVAFFSFKSGDDRNFQIISHNVITSHIKTNLQTGFFSQFNGVKNHFMILNEVAFYK